MRKVDFYIVDVFSQGKYTGNQLAVFVNDHQISNKEMQLIAKEMDYAETTFILSKEQRNGGYDVLIFTPNEEIPFAGHPALGTAFVLKEAILQNDTLENILLHFQGGSVEVTFHDEENVLWMQQNEPEFGEKLDRHVVADVLNIDISQIDLRYPIQEVSTGLPVILVPLKSLAAVKEVQINKEKYFKLIEKREAKGIMVFTSETYEEVNDLNVRDFAEYYGIPEDAATGSSNGCLATYLIKHRYFDKKKINLRVEQGYEIKRPSLLHIRAEEIEDVIDVFVGGEVTSIAKGTWNV
ncbi:PhzF family phenazine biosynthesis protein [Bacillus bingmayongensis]|uniref:PhzF family phenazine biosynthesis protein n=1 Tax=Bacillus bingmayongensis TaxID=1150157 RepID=UPI000474E036|nr:PhzF family phenazine biosynthesis protein [Bacillus bingmayongensis]MBY0599274.1 PhzF family phenazine biosynthesis protein [Bacillus bingmayongensis]